MAQRVMRGGGISVRKREAVAGSPVGSTAMCETYTLSFARESATYASRRSSSRAAPPVTAKGHSPSFQRICVSQTTSDQRPAVKAGRMVDSCARNSTGGGATAKTGERCHVSSGLAGAESAGRLWVRRKRRARMAKREQWAAHAEHERPLKALCAMNGAE